MTEHDLAKSRAILLKYYTTEALVSAFADAFAFEREVASKVATERCIAIIEKVIEDEDFYVDLRIELRNIVARIRATDCESNE